VPLPSSKKQNFSRRPLVIRSFRMSKLRMSRSSQVGSEFDCTSKRIYRARQNRSRFRITHFATERLRYWIFSMLSVHTERHSSLIANKLQRT